MRVNHSRPRGASSDVVPPPPSSTGANAANAANADVPPPTTSDDSNIRRTLDHVLTVQAAQGQILVDVLDEIRDLRANMDFDCPLAFHHKKGEYILRALCTLFLFSGREYFFVGWSLWICLDCI